ncbi:MAG: hypothetical protein PVF43_12640 [Candidatus Eiseniibacteriota bacterium]
MDQETEQTIEALLERDPRYRFDAYRFVLEALSITIQRSHREGHVTAAELLAGIRDYGLALYGPLTREVFHHWGIEHSAQFGDIVFNLIDCGVLGKRDEDRREDFDQAAFDLETGLEDSSF